MPITDSPLRYPGGKTKLYPIISKLINNNHNKNTCTYIEPFAGGAGLALKLLLNHDVEKIILNDIDIGIYSFWYSVLYHTDEFCTLIENCHINLENWKYQKQIYRLGQTYTNLELGFATFFLNRCNVSGIIGGGPIGGYSQTGKYLIDARFNKAKLIKKIQLIGSLRNYIEIYNEDAGVFLQNLIPKFTKNTFLNIDPHYVKKGAMLYENSFTKNDHALLSNIIKDLPVNWIVTYDAHPLIYELYKDFQITDMTLPYSAGKTKSGTELIIYSKNLIIKP